MPGFRIKETQGKFFTAANVINTVDRTTRKALSNFGAFVRQRAKSSIRRRKAVSAPGNPPNSHTGLIGKFLYFAWDESQRSVVIGPALIRTSYAEPGSLGELERGGSTVVIESGFKTRNGRRVVEKKKRTINIKARPFMQPAFDKELPNLPKFWAKARR